MNGVHDMGGMHGMGPVDVNEDEREIFHGEWEKRVFAINNAVGALKVRNIDESRHARERMDPKKYMTSSYYQIWLDALERILAEKGLLSPEELAGKIAPQPVNVAHGAMMTPDQVDGFLAKGGYFYRDEGKPARFKVGDLVRGRNIHPAGHTRLPRYARTKQGEVIADYGIQVFPDANAHGREDHQHLYCVRFSSVELWGADGTEGDYVHIDLWDDHLEAV
jgi:nitrile hydratase